MPSSGHCQKDCAATVQQPHAHSPKCLANSEAPSLSRLKAQDCVVIRRGAAGSTSRLRYSASCHCSSVTLLRTSLSCVSGNS
eukprot:960152-Pyramimonas_sp.AAC.1